MSGLLPILANDEAMEGGGLSAAARLAEEEKNRMRRYFEKDEEQLGPVVEHEPVCLYLETTNRCNLLCTTCPRTYEQLEPEADMPWELFTSLIGQYPGVARVVLHGIGEPMLVKDLAARVAYLKARNIYVLFNTNGTLLTEANGRALIEAGLDELAHSSFRRHSRQSHRAARDRHPELPGADEEPVDGVRQAEPDDPRLHRAKPRSDPGHRGRTAVVAHGRSVDLPAGGDRPEDDYQWYKRSVLAPGCAQ